MSVLPSRGRGVTDCGDGVFTVDTMLDREGQTSLHVIADRGRGIVVDTGTRHSVPLTLKCLEEQGVAPADVDWIVVTHVHLDHAGGTGLLARELPNARILVHSRGARHLVDPTRLWAATLAVYGVPKAQRLYGELLPLESSRLVICTDGQHIDWQGRSLMAIGQQDPVLGESTMRQLHSQIRGCPEPLLLPDAGHFVQEQGRAVAEAAVRHFSP